MKSLSLTIFLGTLLALTIGGVFFVSPAAAETTEMPFISADPQAILRDPVTPLTGDAPMAAAAPADLNADLAAAALAGSFTMELSKAAPAAPSQELAASRPNSDVQAPAAPALSLEHFAASLSAGNANQVTGLFVKDVLAFPVGSQPAGNAAYVTSKPNEVTKFGMAASYGSQAFLAHNYLAGAAFFELSVGQTITLVQGDGSTREYRVESIRRFQALSPDSTQSRFVDLDNGKELSAANLFAQIYNSNNPVVLQTCIENNGISTWGRMFIIAVPVNG
ncbi:MAG: hypothetical protein KIT46_06965 [Anaerolineales bacterium]|nr:hypothetical protein [Anaerolineales bacterium]MCW5855769.1 hypothetical protein [Anaerolineales bacterium]